MQAHFSFLLLNGTRFLFLIVNWNEKVVGMESLVITDEKKIVFVHSLSKIELSAGMNLEMPCEVYWLTSSYSDLRMINLPALPEMPNP